MEAKKVRGERLEVIGGRQKVGGDRLEAIGWRQMKRCLAANL